MLKRKFLSRLHKTKNIHQLDKINFNSLKFIFLTKEKFNFKQILKLFVATKLITLQNPVFLRAKTLQAKQNIKPGYPMGIFKTFRKKNLFNFLNVLKWEVMPYLSNMPKLQKKTQTTLTLNIKNIFLFNNLKSFYFKFRMLPQIHLSLNLNKLTPSNILFLTRYYQLPFKKKI